MQTFQDKTRLGTITGLSLSNTKNILTILLGVLLIKDGVIGYSRLCYYTNWSQFEESRFLPNRIPAQLCTHIVFAFADIRGNNITQTEFNDVEIFGRLNRLKRDRPGLQVLLAVGGWEVGGTRFSRMVSSQASIQEFTNNVIAYLRRHRLDGINIDWQYPTSRGGNPGDRIRFTRLLQSLRAGFNAEAAITGRPRLSLSAALEADITEAREYYQIAEIGRVLDFGCLMAYDLHGDWDIGPGALHHSPLDPDIRAFVQGWIQSDFPAEKLVLGVASFGRSFNLTSPPISTGLGQNVTSGGTPGPISQTQGLLDYGEICAHIARDGWTRVWLENQSVPVAYGNTTEGWQWVGYDDRQSLIAKARFIRETGMAGVLFWSLDHGDFNNLCGIGRWPLLRTLARELPQDPNSTRQPTTPTRAPRPRAITPTATATATTWRPSPDSDVVPTLSTQATPENRRGTSVDEEPRDKKEETFNPSNSSPLPNTTTTTTDDYNITSFWSMQSGQFNSNSLDTDLTPELIPELTPLPTTSAPAYDPLKDFYEESDSSGWGDWDWGEREEGRAEGYRLCQLSDIFGPALTCPPSRGKPGQHSAFFLYCFPGFFAIECRCLPGHFYNRCLKTCDVNINFRTCPMVH